MAAMPHPPEMPGHPNDKLEHIVAFATLAGAQDSVRVFWPTWNATYYAIVTACDEVPNCSGWSNVYRVTVGAAPDVTPPWRITDLHAR